MTYQRKPEQINRYTKTVTLYAQLPDGTIATRKTDHVYQFVSIGFFQAYGTHPAAWNVISWHETRKAAVEKVHQFVGHVEKTAIVTVLENKPAPLTDLPTPPAPIAQPEAAPEPEPMPARAIKTLKDGASKIRIIVFANGKAVRNLSFKKLVARLWLVDLITKHNYQLVEDGANLVSPVSTYNP